MDCGIGSIVWVRRRNGSWWPGQIIGPDDHSTSHLTSPRSGTPVKLLGKEDASVDWYNLEKSKRVKAFRCGEFDDCIEKIEASHEMPLKKREKYARREDAILHALELERELMKKQAKLANASDQRDCRQSNSVKKGVVALPVETQGNDNDKKRVNLKSYKSCENEIDRGCFPLVVTRDVEVDLSEVTPRTRGLQDCGLKIAPTKTILSSPVDPHVSQKIFVDEAAQALASDSLCTGRTLQSNGARQMAYRTKRSRRFYFPSSDSLDYKERLAFVEMPSPNGGEFPYRGSLVGETESTFTDDVESGSSETDSTEYTVSDSDSSETEPDMDVKMAILTETSRDFEEHESTSSEELDELAVTSDTPHLYPRELITCHEAVSKWRLKGKRNNRNLVKRSYGAPDGKGIIYGAEGDFEEGRTNLSHKRMGSSLHCYRNDFSDTLYDDDQMFELEDEDFLTPRAVSKFQNKVRSGADWNDLAWDEHLASKEDWDIKGYTPTYGDRYHVGGRMRSMLINVDVKVQAGYRKEPVPIISLMSKLDGKAIIGHPIQVEVLKDGSSDTLFSAIDDFSNDGIGIVGSSVLPQGWTTARRTANFRVPHSHVLSSNGAEAAVNFPSLDQEHNFDLKLNTESSSDNSRLQKKNDHKKFFKNVPKKLSLSSNQKIRTLSFSAEHSLRSPLHDISSYQTDRLIKPEISVPTTVTCIPVQLVYSRLFEKINRPPLKAASNAALLNTDVERNS